MKIQIYQTAIYIKKHKITYYIYNKNSNII